MVELSKLRCRTTAAAIAALVLALPPLSTPESAIAQGAQQNVTGGTQPQAGAEGGGGENQHGWPTDFVTQVGAGTTNSTTTGYSGVEATPSESPEPSLPDLPSAELCDTWEGTEAHPFCMEKLVR
jgi:hypothetical protein